MKNKPYLIITASDAKYGDFLINHWLASLIPNINAREVDIAILDYGLTQEQKDKILPRARIISCKRDGHVTTIRYRDTLKILKKSHYEQVASFDGGDIIFQANIMGLFKEHSKEFKIASEGLSASTHETALMSKPFSPNITKDILKTTHNKKVLNAGVIIAPVSKFIQLSSFVLKNTKNKDIFGPDQVLINYYLYKNGFFEIERKYNFIIATSISKFKIKNGVFLDENNKPIPIAHNTGGKDFWRPIKDFGYGPEHNKIKYFVYYWLKFSYNLSFIISPLLRLFLRIQGSKDKR